MAKKPEKKRELVIEVQDDKLCIKIFSSDANDVIQKALASDDYGPTMNMGELEFHLEMIAHQIMPKDHPEYERMEKKMRAYERGDFIEAHIHLLVKPAYDIEDIKRYLEELWQERKSLLEDAGDIVDGKFDENL